MNDAAMPRGPRCTQDDRIHLLRLFRTLRLGKAALADARAAARLLGHAGEQLGWEGFLHAPARAFVVGLRGGLAIVGLAAKRASFRAVHDF